MTVIDELLVLLEDGQIRTLDVCASDLPARTRQTISSTLGRLTGRGWVSTKRDRKTSTTTYQITSEGETTVARTLDQVKLAGEWDGRWLFVLFNIPERQRKYRDILRNRLAAVGFGRVQGSLWATARDVRFELDGLLDLPQLQGAVTVLRPTLEDHDAQELVSVFEWDRKTLNRDYQRLIAAADRYVAGSDHDSLEARLLVYGYAKLLMRDPKLPSQYEPAGYLRQEAHTQYEKLRPYCY